MKLKLQPLKKRCFACCLLIENEVSTGSTLHTRVRRSPAMNFKCVSELSGVKQITPKIAVKARRKSGSTHKVSIEIRSLQGKALAIHWLLVASRKRPGRNMALKLSYELVDAAKGRGGAIEVNSSSRS